MSDDVTIEILRSIRDEIRGTNGRIDATNARLERLEVSTSERLDTVTNRLERLERRQVDTEIRLATEIIAVGGAVKALTAAFKENRDHEKRISALEKRVRR